MPENEKGMQIVEVDSPIVYSESEEEKEDETEQSATVNQASAQSAAKDPEERKGPAVKVQQSSAQSNPIVQ